MNKRQLGEKGEERICSKLISIGFEIVAKNYRVREGEIDIIAKKGQTIGFFEVKLRNSLAFGHPVTSLPKIRLSRMSGASLRFISENQQYTSFDLAFYLVTITGDEVQFIPIYFT
jgi:putative endonuclease